MSKQIIKSDVLIQKELELEKLNTEYKKVVKNLKSNKTRLKNDREGIAVIQREMFNALEVFQNQMIALQEKLVEAAQNVLKSKKVSKEEKGEASQMIDDIHLQMPSEEEKQKLMEEFAKERAKEDYERRLYERFHKKPPAQEQKDIRRIYINLSKRFHPDLARNEESLTAFNAIMIRVNEAYEQNDIATLLDIQREYKNHEDILKNPIEQTAVVSFIQQKINKKLNELNLLKGQLGRTREELAELRKSEEGLLLAEHKRFKKSGDDMIAEMEEEMKGQIQVLETLIDGVNQLAKTGEFPRKLQQQLMMQQMFSLFDGDVDEDIFDFFDFD